MIPSAKVVVAAACLSCAGLFTSTTAHASLLGRTVDTQFWICLPSVGQCTGRQRFHAYVSKTGEVFSFTSAAGGGRHALGESFNQGTAAARYTLEGDSLLFDFQSASGELTLQARIVVRAVGDRCSLSGTGQFSNGYAISVQSTPCRIYEGCKAF